MISTADIGELIRNPELAGKYEPAQLAEIRDKFPYCSTLHLLYLKGLSLGNDLQFEDHLRFAAAHVFDRERMYYLVHSGENSERETERERKSEREGAKNPQLEVVTEQQEIVDETPVIVLNPEVQKTEEIIVAEEPVIEKETVAEPIDFTTLEPVIETPQTNLLDAAPDLVEIAYTEDMQEESSFAKAAEDEKDEKQSETIDLTVETIQKPDAAEITATPEVDLSNLSFIEWLQYKQNKQLPVKEAAAEKVTETPKTEEKPIISAEEEPKKTKKAGLSRADVDALLNKFITEEPSISRPTASFFNPTKNAKQSLEESPELVTETLARIYELQKNYAKAIQAYEQLSLVNPEKKTFFAARIQKIKEEQQKQ